MRLPSFERAGSMRRDNLPRVTKKSYQPDIVRSMAKHFQYRRERIPNTAKADTELIVDPDALTSRVCLAKW